MQRLAGLCAVLLIALPSFGGSYLVTSTADTGAGSLRQGVLDANSGTCTSPCTITFDSTLFSTPQTISLSSTIIQVNAPDLTVDGFSGGATGSANTNAFGSADNSVHRVIIDGASNTCCTAFNVLSGATNFTLSGVVIQDFQNGVIIAGTGAVISGCKFGTDATGTTSVLNLTAVLVNTGGSATIGGTLPADRNLISGNSTGISLQTAGNTVLGNYIGVNASGTAALVNTLNGITIAAGSNAIGNSTIGNVISGNLGSGVSITAGTGASLYRNRIGTSIAGTAAVPNGIGLSIGSGSTPGSVIVGASGIGNLISGNSTNGIQIVNSSGANTIVGNTIGLDLGKTAALGNGLGILLSSAGGVNTIDGNAIGSNGGEGIQISGTSDLLVTNNQIGEFGGTPFGNTGNGILVLGATGATTIFNNIIKNNTLVGVDVDGAIIGVGIKQNSIGENGGIGIDLHASATDLGPTPNDSGDPDNGTGNHSQNFPAISSAYVDGPAPSSTLTVTFSVDSVSVGTTAGLRVDAYGADSDLTNPEGLTPLGFACYGGNNLVNDTLVIPAAGIVPGDRIVMTATSYTDASCTSINEGTSEFSPGATVGTSPGIVVHTGDSGPGSLRQAIFDANGGACGPSCAITFKIPFSDSGYSGGVFTIAPLTNLPAITASGTVLDGATQALYSGDTNPLGPEIELNGSAITPNGTGLTISGVSAGEGMNIEIRNVVVNRFFGDGIFIGGSVPIFAPTITGCYIGTDSTGTSDLGNTGNGIFAQNAVTDLQIGEPGGGNIISGNDSNGIYFFNDTVNGTRMYDNGIGTDRTKTAAIPNGGDGVFGIMTGTVIGSTTAGEGNVIAFNTGDGVALAGGTTTQNEIRGNSIHSNGQLGIDLGNDGVDVNDLLDPDGGTNSHQNYPVLQTAVYNSGSNQTVLTGTLNSVANTMFDIDWYSNTTADGSGFGEGETYEGTSTWTTDGSGNTPVSIVLAGNKRFANVTATATFKSGPVAETSELSAPVMNNAPVANPDTPSTLEDNPIGFDPRANDSDPENDPLTITGNTQPSPSAGSVTCSATSCTFSPAADYTGPASFSYTISDGNGGMANGSVTVTVTPVDDPPVANPDTLTAAEETPNSVNVLTNDTDVDTPPASLMVTSWTNGTKGTVNCTGAGVCTYTGLTDQTGGDSFTYTVTDGTTPVNGTVTVTITPVDDPPVANPDVLSTAEETPNSVNVLTNDTDVDTPPAGLSVIGSTNGAKGSVNCSGAGLCTYTPFTDLTGTDSFTYTVTDGTTPVNGTVNVTISPTNDAPVAVDDTLTTNEDTPNSVNVLTNDIDPDSVLTLSSHTTGFKGSVSCTPAGLCTYSPNPNQFGSDSFKYVVTDGTASDNGTVIVTINPVNDPPVAVDDSTDTQQGAPVTINVLLNDTDVDGDVLHVAAFTQPGNGSVSCATSGNCTYTPDSGFAGTDTFTYTAKDPSLASDTATVTLTVESCPGAPELVSPDTGATGVPLSGTLQWADTGAGAYAVYLGRADQGGCSVFHGYAFTHSIDYSNLLPATTYNWRVASVNGSCPQRSSECRSFTTSAFCNGSISILAPIGGERSSPISFQWTALANASQYEVFAQVGNAPMASAGTTNTTTLVASLGGSGTVMWYVVGTVPGCGLVQSPPAVFTLCNRPAVPTARVVGQVTSGRKYNVLWDAVPFAIRYEVDEANDPSFANASTTSTEQTFVEFEHETSEAVGRYYRVRAFSACTPQPSANSTPLRVVIVPLPPSDSPDHSTNVPVGTEEIVVQEVFIPGEPGQTLFFAATTDRPWLTVTPASGALPPEGVTLQVTADPKNLPNGTFTASVLVAITTPDAIRANGTITFTTPVSISLVTPVSPVSSKPEPDPDTLIIPAVGHLDGINSHWQSDIRVTNVGFVSAKYDVTFIPAGGTAGGTKKTTITVNSGATTALDDILKNWFGVGSLGDGANGMLEIRAADANPMSAVASSRTYNVTANGTLGQFIPALKYGSFIGKALQGALPSVLSLQQVAQSALYRTNVGVAEASGHPASVLLSVFDPGGTKLLDLPVQLAAGEQKQLNALLAQYGIRADDARIEVTVPSGDGKVTAYASVVDNETNDPLLVHGIALLGLETVKSILPGVADLTNASANWRTDMRIFNAGLASQTATLTLYPLGGGSALTAEVTLEPGEVRALDDVVRSLFHAENIGGAVHITTGTPGALVVTGRTYNQTGHGTYGQFIPASTTDDAVGAGDRTLHVLQVEDSTRYRTNLGITEVTGKSVKVEVQVVLPDSLVTPTVTFDMGPNEFRQFGIIREMGLGNVYNGRLAVRVVGGEGRVLAYGSVIDMITQDPTYVPAQ